MANDAPKRLATRLTAVGERHLRNGHPWLYDQVIERIKGEGKSGDLAIIFDRRRDRFLGVGLYDPHSPIRIKVLHQGSPARIDHSFFQKKITQAYQLRTPLLATDTNSYRLINGENDGFPGFIADVYDQVLVVKIYTLIWENYLNELLPLLIETSGCQTAVMRLSRNVQSHPAKPADWTDGAVLSGSLSAPEVIFKEHGIRFTANVLSGHKTGFFLDHRHNRKRVGELAKGRRVLDVFSYAGGFSVHALAGGASEVLSVDISQQALAVAKANVALNIANPPHKVLAADAFVALEEMRQKKQLFDLVIIDPPSFAKKATEVAGALRAYRKLTRLAIQLTAPQGILLLASCSARVDSDAFFDLQIETLEHSKRRFKVLERTLHDLDHPVTFPEGSYLKSIYFQL